MLADHNIHLSLPPGRGTNTPVLNADRPQTGSTVSVPSTDPSQTHRYLTDNRPATAPFASTSKSPPAATANSLTRTAGNTVNSRASLATPRRHRTAPAVNRMLPEEVEEPL